MKHSNSLDKSFLTSLQQALQTTFQDAETIAVKIHFGEIGNSKTLKPKDIKPFIDILYKLGKKPFLFDTSIAYPGPRRYPFTHKLLALIKGWGNIAPVKLSDAIVLKQGKYLTYEVAAPLANADGVLIISHVKGHPCTGFGGAIKNLGMGALSKQSKKIIHAGGRPKEEGTCIRCKRCENICPINGIKVTDKAHVRICIGCSKCGQVCPTKYLAPKIAPFDELLADGALSAAQRFKKAYYINILQHINKNCDCNPLPGRQIARDGGFLHDKDLIAIDQASYDVILKQEGKDVFMLHHKKTGLEQVQSARNLLPFFKKKAKQSLKKPKERPKNLKKTLKKR